MPSAVVAAVEAPTAFQPFAFVPPGHPLRSDLERFWAAAAEVPSLRTAVEPDGPPPTVRSVLRLYPVGPPRLKWLCVSVQHDGPSGFASLTLHYRARKRRLNVFALPHDPLLTSLPSLAPEVAEVVQYVPRHRFTFRTRTRREIGKCVRTCDLDAGWQRLRAVWQAAARREVGFAVAEPRRIDRARCAFYQQELPGRDLACSLDGANLTALLRRAGATHAELQSLDVRGVPFWRPHELLGQIREHAALVTLFRPDAAPVVDATLATLLATAPDPGPQSFCHGDLRCGHLLEHEGLWSVIDLDGCRIGDPCQDVARLLAFLKRDVPYLRERFAAADGGHADLDTAIAAFLAGHAEYEGEPLEPARLTWYLLAHELHFLARMFKRDLFERLAFARGVERLVTLRARLRAQLGGRSRP